MSSSNANQRFFDVQQETLQTLPSIEGYEDMPLVSLKMSVQNLESSTFKIIQNAHVATEKAAQSDQQLTQDQSAAIYLYTMPRKNDNQSLCAQLNSQLRSRDRNELIPYYLFLKLFYSALHKLPSVKTTVWRGVKGDMRSKYSVGQTVVWWGFSSCVESLEDIRSEMFLGKTGTRTVFEIECLHGKQIRAYSYNHDIDEVLLLPGSYFRVISHAVSKSELYVIRLKEIDLSLPFLELPSKNRPEQKINSAPTSAATNQVNTSKKNRSSSLSIPVLVTTEEHNKTSRSTKPYENKRLKQQINAEHKQESVRFSKQMLNYNDMQMIADELTTNKHWKMISLWENYLNDRHMTILMNSFTMNKTVISLNLDQNTLGDDGACVLSTALKSTTTLRTIYLNQNRIGDIGCEALADMLQVNKTLKHLELSSNDLSDQGIICLSNALKVNKHLRTLCLNKNKFSEIGAEHLGEMLETNKTLSDLQISSNNIGDSGASALIDALQNNRTLESIDLGETMITMKSMEKIEDMLLNNKTLKCLHLNNNGLGDHSVKMVLSSLTKNKTLTTLDLSRNDLSKRSAYEIGNLLRQSGSTLTSLILSNNRLGDDGISYIASALIQNESLVKLVIENIEMTSEGVGQLSNMLLVNKELRHLCLNNNEIDNESMRLLCYALQRNEHLEYLYLNNCHLQDESIVWIENIFEENETLISMEVVKNEWSEYGKRLVNEVRRRNKTCSIYLDFTFH